MLLQLSAGGQDYTAVNTVSHGGRDSPTQGQGFSSRSTPAGCVHTRQPGPPDRPALTVRRRSLRAAEPTANVAGSLAARIMRESSKPVTVTPARDTGPGSPPTDT